MTPVVLKPGTPAPWFAARAPVNPRYVFDTVAGRPVVLCFYGTAGDPVGRRMLDGMTGRRDRFDDVGASLFGVSVDPEDEKLDRVREMLPGVHIFWDFDRAVSRLYGAVTDEGRGQGDGVPFRRFSVVLDERLRTFEVVPLDGPPEDHVRRVIDCLDALAAQTAQVPAPILVVPRIFEPGLCRTLIKYYEDRGGQESGFMREINGRTVAVHDYEHKRRRDQEISDEPLRRACMVRINDRLVPEIHRAFQFKATRIERYIVACYEAATSGHFRAHRDNTTKGTAHRRFAVSLNLNTGEFEGGDLRFPEFGTQTYTPPAGGAVVFSCSLLHEATPVTAGTRYAFLPFMYDDAAAQVRRENHHLLGDAAAQSAPGGSG